MASVNSTRATLDDLARVKGKAELIGGRIVHQLADGHYPNQVAGKICIGLFEYARRTGKGKANKILQLDFVCVLHQCGRARQHTNKSHEQSGDGTGGPSLE